MYFNLYGMQTFGLRIDRKVKCHCSVRPHGTVPKSEDLGLGAVWVFTYISERNQFVSINDVVCLIQFTRI